MALRIEDYALIGDTHTVALVGTNGSIDWLCLPRFDAPACFAALLGTGDNGFWDVTPLDAVVATRRRYRGPTLVLETDLDTASGTIRLVDCMPPRRSHPRIVRVVEGVRGQVPIRMRFTPLSIRSAFDNSPPRRPRRGADATGRACGGRW